jgi:hypothetical protein
MKLVNQIAQKRCLSFKIKLDPSYFRKSYVNGYNSLRTIRYLVKSPHAPIGSEDE